MPKSSNPSEQITIRLKQSTLKAINEKRESIPRAQWVKDAINEKLYRDRREEALLKSVQNLTASIRGIRSAEKMNFAATVSLARIVMRCLREPTGDALTAAVAVAPDREAAFLRAVAQEYNRDSSELL